MPFSREIFIFCTIIEREEWGASEERREQTWLNLGGLETAPDLKTC